MSEALGKESEDWLSSPRQSPEIENNLTLAHCQLASIRSALNIGPKESFAGSRQLVIGNAIIQVGIESSHSNHMAVTIAPMSAQGESYVVHAQDLSENGFPWQISEFDSLGRALGVVPLNDEHQAKTHASNLYTALFSYADDLNPSAAGLQARFTRL